MPSTGRILLDVAVILAAAYAGGLLFERFGQPRVVGEIAAGVALGPTLLGALPGDPSSALFPADALSVLQLIGQLGLVLFMFTVGWDLDLKLIRHREGAAAAVSFASIALPFTLGLALATHLHAAHDEVDGTEVAFWPFALFIGASLSLTAFPVLARILQETRLAATRLGVLVLTAAAVDDVVGWSVLAAVLAVLASSDAWDYVRIVVEALLFVAVVVVVVRPLLRRLSGAWEALVVPLVLAAAYATEAIGIHAVFGAFLIGAAMPRPDRATGLASLRRRLTPAVGLLAPIYFVMSGMAVDIPGLRAGDLADFGLVLVAACAGKFLGAFAGARAAGVGPRDSAAVGVLMNTRGLIEIVLLTVGRDVGLIDDRLFTMLALMAIVTTLATTPLVRRILRPVSEPRGSWSPEHAQEVILERPGVGRHAEADPRAARVHDRPAGLEPALHDAEPGGFVGHEPAGDRRGRVERVPPVHEALAHEALHVGVREDRDDRRGGHHRVVRLEPIEEVERDRDEVGGVERGQVDLARQRGEHLLGGGRVGPEVELLPVVGAVARAAAQVPVRGAGAHDVDALDAPRERGVARERLRDVGQRALRDQREPAPRRGQDPGRAALGGHVGAARRVAERGGVVDHPIDVAADRLRQRVGAERGAVGHRDAAQPVLAQQAARVAQAPARVAGARQRDGDRVEVDAAVPVGLRQVGEGRRVVEAHVRVDHDLRRVGVRGRRQRGADEECEKQDGRHPRHCHAGWGG